MCAFEKTDLIHIHKAYLRVSDPVRGDSQEFNRALRITTCYETHLANMNQFVQFGGTAWFDWALESMQTLKDLIAEQLLDPLS